MVCLHLCLLYHNILIPVLSVAFCWWVFYCTNFVLLNTYMYIVHVRAHSPYVCIASMSERRKNDFRAKRKDLRHRLFWNEGLLKVRPSNASDANEIQVVAVFCKFCIFQQCTSHTWQGDNGSGTFWSVIAKSINCHSPNSHTISAAVLISFQAGNRSPLPGKMVIDAVEPNPCDDPTYWEENHCSPRYQHTIVWCGSSNNNNLNGHFELDLC